MNESFFGGLTLGSLFGLFDLVAGLLLVAAILTFGAGLATYFARLALAGREESIVTLEQGVRLLFVLVVVLGIVKYVQNNTAVVLGLISIVIVVFGGYLALEAIKNSGASEEKEH